MEIELKYNIVDHTQMNTIWDDEYLKSIEENDSRGTVHMKAVYFDTESLVLSKNFIAFRIRREGDRVIGTLKWGNDDDVAATGLYVREEVNVPVKDDTCFLLPDPGIFHESREGKALLDLIDGAPLVCIFETTFTRRKFRIDNGETICEVSFDEGEIRSGDDVMPISELEIELFSGSQDEMIRIGEMLSQRYGLNPEKRSKYARGLMLTNLIQK
ncbi:MAG: CYTH domain-containing protein [Clostridiales Family XIII bacterium]|jgi:inorganic triphosphatase YgiF|nr:CYTH domain-containing protein [Clostridiales Family XIII bacterium]